VGKAAGAGEEVDSVAEEQGVQKRGSRRLAAIRVFGIFLLCLAPLVLAAGIYPYHSTRVVLATAVPCKGRIVQVDIGHKKDDTVCTPIFEYRDASGQDHRVRANISTTDAEFAVGDAVPVLYSPQNPGDGRLNSFMFLWFWTVFGAGFGGLCLINALVMLWIVPIFVHKFWPEAAAQEKA
jgi:hypothetical protein